MKDGKAAVTHRVAASTDETAAIKDIELAGKDIEAAVADKDCIVLPPGPRTGEVKIPSSKSAAHRLLICAALGSRETVIFLDGFSADILATADCLRALGAAVECSRDSIRVAPVCTAVSDALLPCGESGSTLRFLLPVAGAMGASGAFRMEGRLPERPMREYKALLSSNGMTISRDGNLLRFSGQLRSGDYALRGDISSQYFSGLLLALPCLQGDSRITAEGRLESENYIRMTEDALSLSGVRTVRDGQTWHLAGGQRFSLPEEVHTEGDWSNAAFFLCMGALSEAGVTVRGLKADSTQGDRAVLDILKDFGAVIRVASAEQAVTVRRGTLCPVTLDAGPVPDLIPVLAVLACGAVGDTYIRNAARLRLKESDRLRSTAELIHALGGSAEELPDGLIVHGTGSLRGGTANSCRDHRIAMSAAVAACLCREPVCVRQPRCVEKSYPAFWKDYGRCMTA